MENWKTGDESGLFIGLNFMGGRVREYEFAGMCEKETEREPNASPGKAPAAPRIGRAEWNDEVDESKLRGGDVEVNDGWFRLQRKNQQRQQYVSVASQSAS